MNVVVLNVVAALSMLAVDISYGQTPANRTCDELPKVVIPSTKFLSENGPYQIDYTSTAMFKCTTQLFANPTHGSTDYNGTAIAITGTTIVSYDYITSGDGKTLYGTICSNGAKSVWHASAFEFNSTGGFICLYTCNGTALDVFACVSNNNGTSPKELEAVKFAMSVENGDLIQDGKQNCSARHGCNEF